MPSAVRLRDDCSAATLRAPAKRSQDANQSRRLPSLAAARDAAGQRLRRQLTESPFASPHPPRAAPRSDIGIEARPAEAPIGATADRASIPNLRPPPETRDTPLFPFLRRRSYISPITRIARIVVPGAPHPVTQRGNRREAVFLGPQDWLLAISSG
jgi:hypothetical protein